MRERSLRRPFVGFVFVVTLGVLTLQPLVANAQVKRRSISERPRASQFWPARASPTPASPWSPGISGRIRILRSPTSRRGS